MTTKSLKPVKKDNWYRILSIDGGGIRGLIPATVLLQVEKLIQAKHGDQAKIGDYFDFIAGTSTGGILACLFLCPDLTAQKAGQKKARYSAADAVAFYRENGDKIFDISTWQKIRSLKGLADEKYSAKALENIILQKIGDLQLKDLIKPCLITGYDMRLNRPRFFTQQDADDAAQNYLVRDVMRSTSAAPTFFEPALPETLDGIKNETPVVDGGVFANNPTACALVEALVKGYGNTKSAPGVPIENIVVLSLGTGRKPKTYKFEECKDWGKISWVLPLLEILMEGVSQTVDYQMKQFFNSTGRQTQYLRIDGEFGDYKNRLDIQDLNEAMDCATKENMDRLINFGQQVAQNNLKELNKFVDTYF